MEIKEWAQYSREEKKTLLKHWWYYYGKLLITLEEQEIFEHLVEECPDCIMSIALFSYLQDKSSQNLIYAIRQNRVKELINLIDSSMESVKQDVGFSDIELQFISILVGSYNHPEPDVSMSEEEINRQLKDIGIDPNRVVHIQKKKN